jgi:hypothetical protein
VDIETQLVLDAVADIRHIAGRLREQSHLLAAAPIQTRQVRNATAHLAQLANGLDALLPPGPNGDQNRQGG